MGRFFAAMAVGAAALLSTASVHAQDTGVMIERGDDSDVVGVLPENDRVNAAIERARDTLWVFFEAMDSEAYPRTSFMVKVQTEVLPDEWEYMWYVFIGPTEDGEQFEGYLTHSPFAVGSTYEEGGIYTLQPSEISDWRFLDGERLRGDFTTRAIMVDTAKRHPVYAAEVMDMYHPDPLPPEAAE